MISESEILKANILIVDDNEPDVTLLVKLLSGAGYTSVDSTMNPEEVCALHRKNSYDLILLDLEMPVMDGFQVMECLKADNTDSYLPVLVLTVQPSHKLRALQAGAKDFIAKPFDLVEIKARIHNMLEVRLLYKKLEDYNKVLEQTVQERTRDLRKKDQMLIVQDRRAVMGEMIDNIAHQWRQPLNTLGLVVQQVPIYYDSDKCSREFVNENAATAMKLVKFMSRTIDDFKNFFSSDKEAVTFNVIQVIESTLSLIEKSFQEQNIRIALLTKGELMMNGYPNEYSQVLLNILMNARDALVGHNADDALISIHAFKEGASTIVTITDNAAGIADEIIDRLFDPYFTTKEADKGTGIGLFMSKTIIEKNMGGRLTVRNTGSGAEFRIEV
ncbi:MAG TPA: response regulator [Dongiaceae bacterium]|nr:response regulator [Dongiaceae bacterium]